MPVGQAVTATSERRLLTAVAALAVAVVVPATLAVPVAAAAAAAGASAGAPAAGSSPTTSLTSATTWLGVVAARRLSVNSFFTSALASLASSLRWEASPPAGAAIRKARSAGPSLAPNSTGGDNRAKTSVGVSTPVLRQWGIA